MDVMLSVNLKKNKVQLITDLSGFLSWRLLQQLQVDLLMLLLVKLFKMLLKKR